MLYHASREQSGRVRKQDKLEMGTIMLYHGEKISENAATLQNKWQER